MPTFSHSGMVGDIIYALPTIRELGGGSLHVWPRRSSTAMTESIVASLRPLLTMQRYVTHCVFNAVTADFDLDRWLRHYWNGITIADMTLRAFELPCAARNRPWLTVDVPESVSRVIFHRSPRYRNPRFPWRRVWNKYHKDAVMVGHPEEHARFCEEVGLVPYYPTRSYLELARVIAGCELFVGNQSSPYAIAEALKVQTLQEVSLRLPNYIFERADATYGIDETVILPSLR